MADPALLKDRVWALPPQGFLRSPAVVLPTPYLEVDGARLERNLATVQARATAAGVRLRPHLKTHKSLEIGRRQLELGAVGLTAAKPSEALVFIEAGFSDVTLAYPIVRPESVDALLEGARQRNARINVIVADPTGLDALGTAARRHGQRLACYLKVDVGLGRVGVRHDDPRAVDLARRVADSPDLAFAGLLSHAGHVYAAPNADAIHDVAAKEIADLTNLRARLLASGLEVATISVGSTPTVLGAPLAAGVQEIRPGNYVYLDLTALRLGVCGPDDLALSLIARVVAVNDTYLIIDAGSKALSSDLGPHGVGGSGYGAVIDAGAEPATGIFRIERMSEEHGFVAHNGVPLPVGRLVRVFPNHACATVAQFDEFSFRERDGSVRPSRIHARGCVT